jgi:uncharacterized protein (TIGR02996 family)
MSYDEAFIQAIRAAPSDDAPRLIYADWLEEHGQADRAEFIRVQCRVAQMPDTSVEWSLLKERAEELLRRHWEEWVGPLRDIVGPWRDRYGESWLGEAYHPEALRHFMRGFVGELALDAERFLHHIHDINRLMPLHALSLWRAGRCAGTLANTPELRGVVKLVFADYYDTPLTARDAVALASSRYLDGLSLLFLGRNSLGDEGVEALAWAPWLVSLTYLDLSDNGLSDRGARALAASPYLINLQTLHLERNYLSPDGVAALTRSPYLRRLNRLEHAPFPRMLR